MPTENEYRKAFAKMIPPHISDEDVKQALAERLVDFIGAYGTAYEAHPPRMSHDEFARLTLRYRQPLPMEGDLVRSAYFGEWLEPEGEAINGLFFCMQYAVGMAHEVILSLSRGVFPPDCTGKYKGMKIGFRLAILD
jgi:hypothetical protein